MKYILSLLISILAVSSVISQPNAVDNDYWSWPKISINSSYEFPDINLNNDDFCLDKLIFEASELSPELNVHFFEAGISTTEEIKRVRAFNDLINLLPIDLFDARLSLELNKMFKNEYVVNVVKNFGEEKQKDFFETLMSESSNQNNLLSYLVANEDLVTTKISIFISILHAPLTVKSDPIFINRIITKYLDPYMAPLSNLTVPTTKEFVEQWGVELAKIEKNNIVIYPGSSTDPNSSIQFLPDYVDVKIEPESFGSGAFKYAFHIIGEDKVLARTRHDISYRNPFENIHLINEMNRLIHLKNLGLPTIDIDGITNHRGYPALIIKNYEMGGVKYDIFNPDNSEYDYLGFDTDFFMNNPDAINNQSINELVAIRNKLDEVGGQVLDLQFLIDANNKFYISDPADYIPQIPGSSNYESIDPLIFEIITKQIKASGITQFDELYLKDIFLEGSASDDVFIKYIGSGKIFGFITQNASNITFNF